MPSPHLYRRSDNDTGDNDEDDENDVDLQSIIEVSFSNPSVLAFDFGRLNMTLNHRLPNAEASTPFVNVSIPSFRLQPGTERQVIKMVAAPLNSLMALSLMTRWMKGEDVGSFLVSGQDFRFEGYDSSSNVFHLFS
jgi:hypothetical protein